MQLFEASLENVGDRYDHALRELDELQTLLAEPQRDIVYWRSLLWDIDNDFSKRGELYYGRYMDDFIIFNRTRWHARRTIKRLLNVLTREEV